MVDEREHDSGEPERDAHERDSHLRERTTASTMLLEGSFLRVRRDTVKLPDGSQAGREYVLHPGAVMVVPLLDDGRLVVLRQWRHPVQRVLLEFPAGKRDAGEQPIACAQRELTEETGYRAAEWARAGLMHNACAYSTEGIEVWFARGLVAGEQQLDAGEFVEVVTHTPSELDAMVAQGQVSDVKTLVGLLWWQRWSAGAWPLEWKTA